MVNFPSLDIQSYLLRFGVGPACFWGSKYRTSGGVGMPRAYEKCLRSYVLKTLGPGTKKTSWTVLKLWPWENLFSVHWPVKNSTFKLQTLPPCFFGFIKEGPISKTLPILRKKNSVWGRELIWPDFSLRFLPQIFGPLVSPTPPVRWPSLPPLNWPQGLMPLWPWKKQRCFTQLAVEEPKELKHPKMLESPSSTRVGYDGDSYASLVGW